MASTTRRAWVVVGVAGVALSTALAWSILPASAVEQTVVVRDNFFDPATKTINVNDTVRWTNNGANTHNVTFDAPLSTNLGDMAPGTSVVSSPFPSAGTFTYFCRFHVSQGMRGTIVVTPTSSSTSTTTTTIAPTTNTSLPVQSLGPVNPPLVTTTLALMNSPYVTAGGSFSISGTGFAPSSQLQAFLFSDPVFLGTVNSDVNGNYQALFNIPITTPAGPHTVVVQGPGRTGIANESVATIEVNAAGTQPVGAYGSYATPSAAVASPATSAVAGSGRVAFTGVTVKRPLLVGSLLLVIGLYVALAARLGDGLVRRRYT